MMTITETGDGLALRARAQFREIGEWMARGWQKAPSGRRCPECGGPVWLRSYDRGRKERHRCSYCDWQEEYTVG